MVDHDRLHRELTAFASTLTDQFDLMEALQGVTLAAASALELQGAGVTLHMPHGDTQFVTASDDRTLHVERVQDELHEGPCVDAIAARDIVAVEDLRAEPRWPAFAPRLLEAGFQALAGVPIRFHGAVLGAVNLYSGERRPWAAEDCAAAQLIADLAAGYLVNAHLRRDAQTLAAQLQQALDSRIVIEQAKGVLVGRHALTPDAAFELLRRHARSSNTKLHDVAAAVVAGEVDPALPAGGALPRRATPLDA